LDNNQKKLSEFEEFFMHSHLVPPEKARFYVYWVDKFLKYYQHRPSKPFNQIFASYLETNEVILRMEHSVSEGKYELILEVIFTRK